MQRGSVGSENIGPHLQRCLAFLSLYKKDEIIDSDQVIQLWMANGLLEPPNQKQEWEDVGDRYLNELLSRCLIQKEKDHDKSYTFKMHDLIHDLALDVSRKECKTLTCQTETVDENLRHLSFCDNVLLKVLQDLKKLKNVRTVIVQEVPEDPQSFEESVINLCVSNLEMEPEEEADKDLQLSLKTFSLGFSDATDLPRLLLEGSSTLQQISIDNCRNLVVLPTWLQNLTSLHKLEIINCRQLSALPERMDCLIGLRQLSSSTL